MALPAATAIPLPAGDDIEWERDGFAFVDRRLVAASGNKLWCWPELSRPPELLWTAPHEVSSVAARPSVCDRVAVVAGGDLWTVALDGDARQLGEGCLVPGTAPVWSPDGERIAIAQGEVGFGVVELAATSIETIGGAPDADPHVWDSDGVLLVEGHPLGKFREWYWLWKPVESEPSALELSAPYYTSPDNKLRVSFSGDLAHVTIGDIDRRMSAPRGANSTFGLAERARWVGRRWLAIEHRVELVDFESAASAVLFEDFASHAAATTDGLLVVLELSGRLLAIEIDERALVWKSLADPDAALPRVVVEPRRDKGLPKAVARYASTPPEDRKPSYARCERCGQPCSPADSPPVCRACREAGE